MTDVFSKSVRSSIMSKIRSKNTKCELVLCAALKQRGVVSFKRHYSVVGKPDFAFPQLKLAVFCDSDFWHGKSRVPKTNQKFWEEKFQRNRKRDKFVNKELKKLGWKTIRFSEKQVLKNAGICAEKVLDQIKISRQGALASAKNNKRRH